MDLSNPPNQKETTSLACLDDVPSELMEWVEDPVTGKWEKIRSAFYNGKSAREVWTAAKTMPMPMWLDLAQRMAPKQVDVRSVQITAIRVELPPLSGFGDGVIDVEWPTQL